MVGWGGVGVGDRTGEAAFDVKNSSNSNISANINALKLMCTP